MKYTITAAVSSQTASERTYEIEANSEDEALRIVLKSGKEILSEDIEDYVTCVLLLLPLLVKIPSLNI